MPLSTIVPTAIAIPERAIYCINAIKYFMAIKHIKTATGNEAATNKEDLKLNSIKITTIIVISISNPNASCKVPNVSLIKSVRS
ncbi:MAG: hypothetical protein R2777_09320 [Chitinophagales bacterium]